jgi:hypothetical protein
MPREHKQDENLPLHELVAIAAFLAGADRKSTDTEDIAIKANEIAPGRFTWRKYKDQIDIELIYKHLWDLTKPDKGEFVTGSKSKGWQLTLAGTAFAEKAVDKLHRLKAARERPSRSEMAWQQRERKRMLSEPAYVKAKAAKVGEITSTEAERFFRLDDYVIGAARTRKIQQAENAFHTDTELGPIMPLIAAIVRGKK